MDENFVAKATPVLKLYTQAQFLLTVGFYLISLNPIPVNEINKPRQVYKPKSTKGRDKTANINQETMINYCNKK